MNFYVECVKNSKKKSINFEGNIEEHFNNNNVRKSVKDIVYNVVLKDGVST